MGSMFSVRRPQKTIQLKFMYVSRTQVVTFDRVFWRQKNRTEPRLLKEIQCLALNSVLLNLEHMYWAQRENLSNKRCFCMNWQHHFTNWLSEPRKTWNNFVANRSLILQKSCLKHYRCHLGLLKICRYGINRCFCFLQLRKWLFVEKSDLVFDD